MSDKTNLCHVTFDVDNNTALMLTALKALIDGDVDEVEFASDILPRTLLYLVHRLEETDWEDWSSIAKDAEMTDFLGALIVNASNFERNGYRPLQSTEYYLEDGTLLFTDPFVFKSSFRIGQDIVHEHKWWLVTGARLTNGTMRVTIKEAGATTQ